jgi:hypothetical protein
MRAILTLSWLASAVAAGLVFAPSIGATTYYWDTNGATSGIGSVGGSAASWLSNNWATASTGTAATVAWPNTQPANVDEAVFQGTAGTVNLGAAVYANALRFQTNNYTLASTGGMLNLAGNNPKITVNLPNNGQVVTISAPIVASGGWNLAGPGGNKFLVLANANLAVPNTFGGPLTIEAGGALRLGGGQAAEQIPDDSDLSVSGVIDFITSGGASDMKQEKVRNVTVSGAGSNFSVGNGSDFIVNSVTGTNTNSIAVNGNNASVPGKLSITGWHDGNGKLALNSSTMLLNNTGSQAAIGGRIVLAGNIESTGDSQVVNNNGGGANTAEWDDNVFTNRAFDFAGAAHSIHVVDGVLKFTSRAPSHPLEITTTQPGGAVITKTGPGTWFLENAVQTSFEGAIKIQEGEMRLGRPALAEAANVYLSSGATLNLSFNGVNAIDSLYLDDVSQLVGTWGRLGHPTADFTSALLTGDGLLQVTTFVPQPLIGDFNNDKIVDAADYTVWRDNLGANTVLPNDQSPGMVTGEDYEDWKANFGMAAPGHGVGSAASAVPEVSTAWMMIVALAILAGKPSRIKGR